MARKFLAGGPRRAVDALQHRIALAAPPVGAAHPLQGEMAEPPGGGHVGAQAQVDEAVGVAAAGIVAVAADRAAVGGLGGQVAVGARPRGPPPR